jgi:hypothetical protein
MTMKTVRLLFCALSIGAILPPLGANAAGPDFCANYAAAAVRQSYAVRQNPLCARAIVRNPARWTLERRVHFEWCRSVPAPAANAERAARRRHLLSCR